MANLEITLETARVRAERAEMASIEYWSLVPNETDYDTIEEMLKRREDYIRELEIALFGKSLEKEL